MTVDNKVVMITGATGGLGRVVTKVMAEHGAKLAIFGRSLENLETLAGSLDTEDDYVVPCPVKVGDVETMQQAAKAVFQKFGRADILIHLVGGYVGGKPIIEVTSKEISSMLDAHVWNTFYATRAFVPYMVKNGWGRLIAISSPTTAHPLGNSSPVVIGRAGKVAIMLSLAQELKGTGVTANLIQVRKIDFEHQRDKNPSTENNDWTTPEEIAATMLYLCSENAGMVNGARIPLYGSP